MQEGIDQRDGEALEVAGIACGDGEAVDLGDCGYHCVFDQELGLPRHQSCSLTGGDAVEGEYDRPVMRDRPTIYLGGFSHILPASDFRSDLDFVKRYSGHRKRRSRIARYTRLEPRHGASLSQLREDVGVQKERQNLTGLRIFHCPRGGI